MRTCPNCGRDFAGYGQYGLCPQCYQTKVLQEQHYEQMQQAEKEHYERMQQAEKERELQALKLQLEQEREWERIDQEARHNERMEDIEREKLQFEKEREAQRQEEQHEKKMIEDPVFARQVFDEELSDIHGRLVNLVDICKCNGCGKSFSAKDANYGNEYCCRSCIGVSLGLDVAKCYVAQMQQRLADLALRSSSIVNVLTWLDQLEFCDFSVGGANLVLLEHLRELFECYDLALNAQGKSLPVELTLGSRQDLSAHCAIREFLEKEASIVRRMKPEKTAQMATHTCGGIYAQLVSKQWLKELLAKDLNKLALALESFPAAKSMCFRGISLGIDIDPMSFVVFWSSFAKGSQDLKAFLPSESYKTLSKLLTPLLNILKCQDVQLQIPAVANKDLLKTANEVAVWMHDNAKTSADFEITESIFAVLDKTFSVEQADYYLEACQNRATEFKRKELDAKKREEEKRLREEEERRREEEKRREAERRERDRRELEMIEQRRKQDLYEQAWQLLKSRIKNSKPFTKAIQILQTLNGYKDSPKLIREAKIKEYIGKHDEHVPSQVTWILSAISAVLGVVILAIRQQWDVTALWIGGGLLAISPNIFFADLLGSRAKIRLKYNAEPAIARNMLIGLTLILLTIDMPFLIFMTLKHVNAQTRNAVAMSIKQNAGDTKSMLDTGMRSEAQQLAEEKHKEEQRIAQAKRLEAEREAELLYQKGEDAYYGRNGVQKNDVEAISQYRLAAELGHEIAQYKLGVMYEEGRSVFRNYTEAAKWFRMAAERHYVPAEYKLGAMYEEGRGVNKNNVEAAKWFKKAAQKDNVTAQRRLGVMYAEGVGVKQDDAEAVKWLRMAAEGNDAIAQDRLGVMYAEGRGVSQSYYEAVKWFRKAADQNYANAQDNLGCAYSKGQGVPKNNLEAVELFRKAAEQNYGPAQYHLGLMYDEGRGVPHLTGDALKWFRMAAEQNNADAQYYLSTMYEEGRNGVPQSETMTMKWLRMAAENNHVLAQSKLGCMYAEGKGVPKSYSEAVKWFRKAAEQNFAFAQYMIGVSYESGLTGQQDKAEAIKWYRKAADQGLEEAQKALRRLGLQ